jgi:hypothetical protein
MVRLEAELAALKGQGESGEADTPEVKKSRPRKAKAQTPHPEPEAGIP